MESINTPGNHLKQYQTILFQIGLIITLTLFIVVFRLGADRVTDPELLDFENNPSVLELSLLNTASHRFIQLEAFNASDREEPTPPAPPRAPVVAHAPEDEIVEDFDIDAELDMENIGPDYLPVPLPPIQSKIGYMLGDHRLPDMAPALLYRMKELQDRIKYPEIARRHGIEGRVFVQFILNELGEVESPKVLRGIGGGCDEAVVEALKEMRFWPGLIDGRPVRVRLTFFVEFRLIYR